ncbi:MAG: hypothetical protein AB4372_37710 [Xenococcus sp. (in: cyanobacteria)]
MTEPFKFSDGQLAYTPEELISLCQKSPAESLNYLMREDFEKWLNYIGKSDLAAKAQTIRQASIPDSDRLQQFISQYQSVSPAAKKSAPKTTTVSQPKAPAAPTAPKVATTSTATKKPNPLASLFQKLFGKKQVAPNQE